MTATARVVFATRQPPHPADTGARIRIQRLVRVLSERLATTLVTFEHDPRSGEHVADRVEIEHALPGVNVVTVPGVRASRRVAQARSLMSPLSWSWGQYALGSMREAIRTALPTDGRAVVHLDDPGVALAAIDAAPLTVFAPHNVEHRILRDTARVAHGPRRAFGALEWRKAAREEQRLWRRATLCLAVSEVDAAAMRAGGASRVEICPNGADPLEPLPPPRRGTNEPLRVLFVGSLSYAPYRHGLGWLLDHVLPALRSAVSAEVAVVGGTADGPVPPGVRFLGKVPSVAPWYAWSHVTVVPVFQGSGTRLKILEAIAYGRPVVSTRLGAEGLPLRPGVHYLEADEPEPFAEALAAVARDAERDGGLDTLLARAREEIDPLLWPHIGERLARLYASLLEGDPRGA